MASGHAEALMPMVAHVLAAAELTVRAIDRIVVTHGPGTFTGTRIGIAAARGLALATKAEIATVSSLRALGLTALGRWPGEIAASDGLLVAVAARNGEVYAQSLDAQGAELGAPRILAIAAAAALTEGRRVVVIGSGAASIAGGAPGAAQTELRQREVLQPDARALLDLAVRLPVSTKPPMPLYLRAPDAKPPAASTVVRSGP